MKPLLLVETIGLQQYSFHLVGTVPFNGRHFLHWKLFLLLEAIHFSENHSFQQKPFPVVEAIPFRESLCFSWKSLPHFFQQKLLLLIETFPFSGSHSFQCCNISVRRSYRQLRELLNINDSIRLLKMANLSCIHIPVVVFQSSEAYLGSCRTSGMKRFCENCKRLLAVDYFCKNAPSQICDWVLNTPLELFFYIVQALLEFQRND